MARGASWFVAVAAFTLIAVSVGSYFYHRRQLDSIAARHLRLLVTGSGQLQVGMASVYNLLATTVTGEPWATQVEWSLSTSDGKRLVDRKENTDDQGRLNMVVPADMDLYTRSHGPAQLTVTAGGNASPVNVTMALPVRPARYLTRLWLDRCHYRPGETVYYRSLTVSRYSLAAHRTLPVEFEILDPKSAPMPGSRIDGLTDFGVGNGSFRLPDALPAGTYTLIARGFDEAFPEERLAFQVLGRVSLHFHAATKFARDGYGPGDDVVADLVLERPDGKPAAGVSLQLAAKVDEQTVFQKITKTDGEGKLRVEFALPRQLRQGRSQLLVTVESGDRSETISEAIPIRTSGLHCDFYPEGGALAASIENRVFFTVRDAKGQPLAIRGSIVDPKGASVAQVETARNGLGVFGIVPDAAETYRLKITEPAGVSELLLLPPASADQKIAIATGRSVFASGAPLEFKIHEAKECLPLVIAARVRGMLVGQQVLVAAASEPRTSTRAVSIPLDDQVAGVIRLTVYDYATNPPRVVADRFVYRQPRRLIVRAGDGNKNASELSLSIRNEKGQPVAAALGLKVLDGRKNAALRPDCCGPDLLHTLFFDGSLDNPAVLQTVDLNSCDAEANKSDGARNVPAALIDLALGCQRPRGVETQGGENPTHEEEEASPPMLFDNLNELRAQYEATLSEYRAKRTQVVNALIMLSFFGGLALALFVTMLAILRIVWGSRLWLPTVVATVCCVVVTAVSNEPSRMKPVEATATGFAPCLPRPDAGQKDRDRRTPAGAEPAAAGGNLRILAEKLGKMGDDSEELKSERFALRQYAWPDTVSTSADDDSLRPLAWYPLLIAGPDGRVTVPAVKMATGKPLRLIIDAHDDGRMESCELPQRRSED
jgi:hypothetical protein